VRARIPREDGGRAEDGQFPLAPWSEYRAATRSDGSNLEEKEPHL